MFTSLAVAARMAGADDVAVARDGSVWVSDATSTVEHFSASGGVLQRISGLPAPEGIVVLTDGSLLLAEQSADRVVHMQPNGVIDRVVIQLTPRSGALGVDGIAYDTAHGLVLVPDSANGTLLSVSLSSGSVTPLASGLGRPVGADVLPDGSIAVAAEDAHGLVRVAAAGGAVAALGDVTHGDDVVVASGLAYVTSLTTHQLLAVDPATGITTAVVDGVDTPQGLAADGTRLLLADSTTGTVAGVAAC